MVKIRVNKNFYGAGLKWGVFIFFLIAIFYFSSSSLSLAAMANPLDYVRITPGLITFSKNEIVGGEIYYILISGRVVWAKSFPLFSVLASATKEAKIIFSIEAQNKITGDWIILNPAHAVYVKKPFPKRTGEYYQAEEKIPLRFPGTAESGEYNVAAKLLKADAKLYFFGWTSVKSYFPQSGSVGSVKYTKQ